MVYGFARAGIFVVMLNNLAQLSVIAPWLGLRLSELYRLMRLPDAPSPVTFRACVPLYDPVEVEVFVRGRIT